MNATLRTLILTAAIVTAISASAAMAETQKDLPD